MLGVLIGCHISPSRKEELLKPKTSLSCSIMFHGMRERRMSEKVFKDIINLFYSKFIHSINRIPEVLHRN